MKAQAIMRFHFWGHASSEIYVVADTPEVADKILSLLKFETKEPVYDACGNPRDSNGWVRSDNKENNKFAVIGWFAGEDLDVATKPIKQIRGGGKIDSMAQSIDRGPLCELEWE